MGNARLVATALVLVTVSTAACGKKGASSDASLHVAAASDLAEAFTEMGSTFEKDTGRKVTFSFGASGLLAKQIEEGAPYDVFAAANLSFIDDAIKSGACDGATKAI